MRFRPFFASGAIFDPVGASAQGRLCIPARHGPRAIPKHRDRNATKPPTCQRPTAQRSPAAHRRCSDVIGNCPIAIGPAFPVLPGPHPARRYSPDRVHLARRETDRATHFTCNCSTHHRYRHPRLDPRFRCSSMTAGKKRALGPSPGDDREMDVGFIALARHLRMERGHIVRGCRPERRPQARSYRNDCSCSTRYGSTTAIMAVDRRSVDRCAAQQKRRRLSPAPPLPIAVEATVCRQLRAAGSKRRVLRRCSRSRRHGLPTRHT